MANRLIPALNQVINSGDVQIGIGFKLYTYQTNTTTPLATYTTEELTIENEYPLEVLENGYFPDAWVSDLSLYKIILNDADDVLVISADPVDGESNSLTDFNPMPTVFLGTTSGDGTNYILAADPTLTEYLDNQTFLATFHTASNADASLDIDGLGALNLQYYDDNGDLTNVEANTINGNQTYLLRNTGTSFALISLQSKAATTSLSGTQFLSSFITISNDATDADHDIDFSAGTFNFASGDGQTTLSALIKQIDASWAVGTNAGGLFIGTVAANTWYHCWAIYNPTTEISDAGFDLTGSGLIPPNLPSGYTEYLYRGSILTDSSANILAYNQTGNEFYFANAITNYSGNSPTSSTPLSVSVPPDISPKAILSAASLSPNNSSNFIRFIKNGNAAATPVVGNSQYQIGGTSNTVSSINFSVPTDSNSQIAWQASASINTTVNTWGFIIPINYLI